MRLRTRRATVEDLEFVLSAWRENYRMSHMAGPIPMSMYDQVYAELLGQLVRRPDVEVLIAHAPGESPPNDIFGFICIERDAWTRVRVLERGQWIDKDVPLPQPVVHYVYVKQPFRNLRIAHALFEAAGVDVGQPWTHTFSTAVVARMRHRHLDGRERRDWWGTFDPRLARFPKRELPKHEPTEE